MGDRGAEELERAEHGLARREESEILTQAAVDALRPAAAVRRPSVVQFRELDAVAPGPETELASAKSKFQVGAAFSSTSHPGRCSEGAIEGSGGKTRPL